MRVYDKRLIEGVEVLGVIHNGGYFLTRVPVYEDGSFDCWERVDMDGLAEKISRGWLCPRLPVGEALSIFHLGSVQVERAEFHHDGKSYLKYLKGLVRQQNSRLEGLYHVTLEQKARWLKHRVGWRTMSKPYKVAEGMGYRLTEGTSAWVFYHGPEGYQVTSIAAFGDGTLAVDALDGEILTMEMVDRLFDQGILTGEIDRAFWLDLPELGRVYGTLDYAVGNAQKRAEIRDMLAEAKNEPSSSDICLEAYHDYLVDPSEESRERLKNAYEAVPEHLRCYLGDMDTRDSDIIRIIYYPEQKREV